VREQHHEKHAETLSDSLRTVLKIRCSNEEFYCLYRQALEDIEQNAVAALHAEILEHRRTGKISICA